MARDNVVIQRFLGMEQNRAPTELDPDAETLVARLLWVHNGDASELPVFTMRPAWKAFVRPGGSSTLFPVTEAT